MDGTPIAPDETGSRATGWRGPERHPLDRDLAALSRDAYAAGPSGVPGWELACAADLERMGLDARLFDDPASGYHARLYAHASHGHALAMRGSEDAHDWLANLRQGVGRDEVQYRQAAMAASRVRAAVDGDLVLTGHSLGGGLAALASLRAGVPAVTFNAAGIHDRTLALHGIPGDVRRFAAASGHVRHYTVENDLVTVLQVEAWRTAPLLPDPIGHRIRLRDPDPLGRLERLLPGSAVRHGLDRHAIDTVLCAFDAPEPGTARPHPVVRLLAQSVAGLRAMQEARATPPVPVDRFFNLSASIAARAYEAGLRRIDGIAASEDGARLFAIEGSRGDPAQRRVAVDAARGSCGPAAAGIAALRQASLRDVELEALAAPTLAPPPPLPPPTILPPAGPGQAPAITLSTWPRP